MPEWIDLIPNMNYHAGDVFEYFIENPVYRDPDLNQELSFTASGMPSWLNFNSEVRSFSGFSNVVTPGIYTITVTISDGYDTADE